MTEKSLDSNCCCCCVFTSPSNSYNLDETTSRSNSTHVTTDTTRDLKGTTFLTELREIIIGCRSTVDYVWKITQLKAVTANSD